MDLYGKNNQTKKRLLKEAHEMVKDLHDAGIVDLTTMREFKELFSNSAVN